MKVNGRSNNAIEAEQNMEERIQLVDLLISKADKLEYLISKAGRKVFFDWKGASNILEPYRDNKEPLRDDLINGMYSNDEIRAICKSYNF